MREFGVRGFLGGALVVLGVVACGTRGGGSGAAPAGSNTPGSSTPGSTEPSGSDPGVGEEKSSLARLAPSATDDEVSTLVTNDAAFGFALFGELAADQNLVFSPHSISTALAMLYPGAAGTTKSEMQSALHFDQPDAELEAAFNTLTQALDSRGANVGSSGGTPFQLALANAVWGQRGAAFLPSYLDVLAENFGAGLETVDFAANPEAARNDINGWVSDHTAAKIPELLEPGVVTTDTKLVLTNAIYFDASWANPFDAKSTQNQAFTELDGTSVDVPVMETFLESTYAAGSGWQAVELPYLGQAASMLVILPDPASFTSFRTGFTTDVLAAIDQAMQSASIDVALPRFEIRTATSLAPALEGLGMHAAFSPTDADLSGIDGARDLFVSDVVHQAYISVAEAGTEAAAATAVVVRGMAAPDRSSIKMFDARTPFLFAIRDVETKAVLFWGEVVNPLG